MKLTALDSFYTDETKMISDGSLFEVKSEAFGSDLIKRGLAREAKAVEKDGKDFGSASANKDAGAAPSNKAAK